MINKTAPTFWVKIYLSGPLDVIEQSWRQDCLMHNYCVTVTPTKFIYSGGEEFGCEIGFINYPKFPGEDYEILDKARRLAGKLLEVTCQHSILIMNPKETEWFTKRE